MSAPTKEAWAEFPDEAGYWVSTLGRVKGPSGRILKASEDGRGYFKIHTRSNGPFYRIHRMVLTTFAGRPAPGQVARHLNGRKSDNRIANLTWGSLSENGRDCVEHGQHTNASKTHCPAGHPYAGPNLGLTPKNHRFCRACKYVRDRRRVLQRRGERAEAS